MDAGLNLDGITTFDVWDLIVAVLYGNTYQNDQVRGDPFMTKREVRSTPHTIQKRKRSQGVINDTQEATRRHTDKRKFHT